MKLENKSGKDERAILTAFIVSTPVLARIAPKYEKDSFQSEWGNTVAKWCIDFYRKYKKAPNKSIESLFDRWSRKQKDKDTINLVSSFLSSLSDEYDTLRKEINVDYLIDRAGNYFNRIKLLRLRDDLETALDEGEVTNAEKLLNTYRPLELGDEEFFDPFTDTEAHKEAYTSQSQPLFRYPGTVGRFFGDQIQRGNFFAFQGPEKSGKSFWLQDFCHRATRERLKVAYFGIGDMSKNQTLKRIQERLCRRPIKKRTYFYPVEFQNTKGVFPTLPTRQKRRTKKKITFREIEAAREKFRKFHLRSHEHFMKMMCTSNMSLAAIQTKIQRLQDKDNWTPDIIAIDYADLLERPIGKENNKLEAIDENWRQMRNLALQLHCLVVTATQVKRTAYKKLQQDLSDTADQKTKAAHVTGMVGINFNDKEYEAGVRRLNWAVPCREGMLLRSVKTAGCFPIANPCILSCL